MAKARIPDAVRKILSTWGRLGGKRGGKARMAALTPEERSALGKLAAEAKRKKRARTGKT